MAGELGLRHFWGALCCSALLAGTGSAAGSMEPTNGPQLRVVEPGQEAEERGADHQGADTADGLWPVAVPSGGEVGFFEMLWDRPGYGLTYRFRFVAPQWFEADLSDTVRDADLEFLCNSFAMPRLSRIGPKPSEVVISVTDSAKEFGIYDEAVMERFESFEIVDGACSWVYF